MKGIKMNKINLINKTAIITGGAQGIGKALAQKFASCKSRWVSQWNSIFSMSDRWQ